MKTTFLVLVSLVLLISGVILLFVAKEFIVIIVGLAFGMFGFYALWNPPKKHKDFSLHDQNQAAIRAYGGSGIPDLSKLEPREQKTKRRK